MKKKKMQAVLTAMLIAGVILGGCGRGNKNAATDNLYADGQGMAGMEVEAFDAAEKGFGYNDVAVLKGQEDIMGPNINTEEYNSLKELGYKSVKNEPLSTFSADVDTASYSNLRRMITENWSMESIPNR